MPTYNSSKNNGYWLQLDVNSTEYVSTNSSNISYTLWLKNDSYKNFAGAQVYSGYLNIDNSQKWNVTGSHMDFGNTGLAQSYTKKLVSGKANIKHNSDGSKTINLRASFSAPSGGYGPENLNINVNWSLPKITVTPPKPTNPIKINDITWADDNTNASNKFGFLIENVSKPHFYVSVTPSTGATVSKVTVSFDGSTYIGHDVHTNKVIHHGGDLLVKVTAVDSKGQRTTFNKTVPVEKYENPKIKEFNAYRCNANGEADDSGEYAKVSYAYNVSHLKDKNTVKGELFANGTTRRIDNTNFDVRGSDIMNVGGGNKEIRITVSDYFNATTKTYQLKSVFTTMDFGENGDRVAIGGLAENKGLTVYMDSNFKGKLQQNGVDVVTEKDITPFSWGELAAGRYFGDTMDGTIVSVSGKYKQSPDDDQTWAGILITIPRFKEGVGTQSDYKWQIFMSSDNRVYVRNLWSGRWNPWKQL